MAASLDGYIAPRPGSHWLTGELRAADVRELRTAHDAVIVGAGTVRVDDPQFTVRPPHARRTPYAHRRLRRPPPSIRRRASSRRVEGYAQTIVLAPRGLQGGSPPWQRRRARFVGGEDAPSRLGRAMRALKLAASRACCARAARRWRGAFLEQRLVDRLDWLVAPRLLANQHAVPALAGDVLGDGRFALRSIEQLGDDLLVSMPPVEAPDV